MKKILMITSCSILSLFLGSNTFGNYYGIRQESTFDKCQKELGVRSDNPKIYECIDRKNKEAAASDPRARAEEMRKKSEEARKKSMTPEEYKKMEERQKKMKECMKTWDVGRERLEAARSRCKDRIQ